MAKTRRIMLCPVANQSDVNTYLDGRGHGPSTFNVLILDSGDASIYYLCNWNIDDDEYTAISSHLDTKNVLRYTGQTDAQVLSSLNCRYALLSDI